MDQNVITGAIVAVSALATQLTTVYRDRKRREAEARNREWDLADRAQKAAETKAAVLEQASRTAMQTANQTDRVLGAIAENTQITVRTAVVSENAYSAANDVNTKILKIHARIDGVEAEVRRHSKMLLGDKA
jgi:hypothetical protein